MASLLATFVALLITDLLSDSLDIEGAGTSVAATLIVWLATMIVDFVSACSAATAGASGPRVRLPAESWYSAFGIQPSAFAIRFVRLNMAVTSAMSMMSSSLQPTLAQPVEVALGAAVAPPR